MVTTVIPLCAFAQNAGIQNYVVTHWGLEEGLPQSSVNDIIQSQSGYLWMATFGGLVRFDGNTFTSFNRSNTPGMRSDRVLHIFEDADGILWLSTEDGFIRFENGIAQTFFIEQEELQVFSPKKVLEDRYGVMWLTINNRVYRKNKSVFEQVDISIGTDKINTALADTNGVWLGMDKVVMKTYRDEVIQIYDLSPNIEHNIIDVIEYPKGSGILLVGTNGDGIIKIEDDTFTFYDESDGLPSKEFWKFYVDKQQVLWVNSYAGTTRYDGTSFRSFKPLEAEKDMQFVVTFEDSEGNYWFGTSGEGLIKVRPSIINTIDVDDGIFNEKMLSIASLQNELLVFATNCGGVYTWTGNRAIVAPINQYLPNQCVWTVFQQSNGDIWFGSKGLYRSKSLETKGEYYGEEQGFTDLDVFAMMEDRDGNLWIGCINGVYKFDGEQFQRFSTLDGLSYNDTRVIYEDTDGSIWFGSAAGLTHYSNGVFKKVSLSTNSTDIKANREPYIRAIHRDEDGVLWLGTYGDGLFRIKGASITQISSDNGLFDNIVSHIVEDEAGNFWMGSNRGIFRAQRSELNEFSEGKKTEIRSYSYGTGDGMKSPETNGGFQPSTYLSSNGDIYFPTVSGVSVVSTRKVESNNVVPPLFIETLRTSDQTITNEKSITLPYNNSFLEINYTALSFTEPKKLSFRYMMEGLDDDWIEIGNHRMALYSKIPAGHYTFRVTASNNDGEWNIEGASIQVIIVPPFWQTNWFYTLIGLVFIALGPSIYYFRIRKLTKENERQKQFTEQLIESQEQERRRIASDLHDGLGQQILVIKNRVELAKQNTEDKMELNEQLNEILQSAVHSINDVRTISHALRPVMLEKFGLTEALQNLCDELEDASTITWSNHIQNIDGLISPNKEINFYRVIQEGINNILKHSKAKHGSIIIRKSNNLINASIWDDGTGIDVNSLSQKPGLGLQGMKERISSLGGQLEIQSIEGEGTSIRITLGAEHNGKTS